MTTAARSTPIASGDAVPDFELDNQERQKWRLGDAVKRGDVVLCLFPFAFTGVCGTEMKCITREMGEWKKKGATVVGMSCDSPFVLKAWAAAEGFQHTLLSDQHRKVTRDLGLYWPEMNTTKRATIVIRKSPDGQGKAKWVESREPGKAMDWDTVMSKMA